MPCLAPPISPFGILDRLITALLGCRLGKATAILRLFDIDGRAILETEYRTHVTDVILRQ